MRLEFFFLGCLRQEFFLMDTLVEEGSFFGGGGGQEAGGYSSILEKQMRKIYDQFGTMPSNETKTLKFPLLRFVSSNPLLKNF